MSFSSDSDDDLSELRELQAIVGFNNHLRRLDLLEALEDSSDDDTPRIPRPRSNIERDRVGTRRRLYEDYFDPVKPRFNARQFQRRFRMNRDLFIRICRDITHFVPQPGEPIPSYISFFSLGEDAVGRQPFNVFQKCTSAIRQLAYGTAPDSLDEYLHMGEKTAYDCLDNFCKSVFRLYSTEYLRKPNANDVQRLITKHQEIHGFPGMLGSLDCMHWAWKNCPVAWRAHYTRGDHGHPTLMLEAVASYDLWIWHAYFGTPGSNNDINVLNQSDLFNDLLQDIAPPCNFTVNGCTFKKGYYLADGIYPEWATLVKSFKHPTDPKTAKFSKFQESARKDIERAFGVLQGRWSIITNPCRKWYLNNIKRIMYTCVILHNMIVQDNGRALSPYVEEDYPPVRRRRRLLQERLAVQHRMDKEIRDSDIHQLLRHMLVEHVWKLPTNFRCRNDHEAGPSNTQEDDSEEETEGEDEDEDEGED